MRSAFHTTAMVLAAAAALTVGCNDGGTDGDTDATGPEPAPLVEPSSPCPTIDGPGEYTFTVDGEERTAWIGIPSSADGPYPVWFGFHGLGSVGFDMVGNLVAGLGLESVVEDQGVIIVVPQSGEFDMVIQRVQLWGILTEEDKASDLAFVDDLRACVAEQYDADLARMHAFGFSGGALWTSVLAMDRSDVFASAVTLSGGVDVSAASGLQFPVMDWRAPAERIPMAIMDGGPTDTWPGGGLVIIDFDTASASLAGHLEEAGHAVTTCDHGRGHTFPPSDMWTVGRRWMLRHTFGEPSPWASGDGNVPAGCVAPVVE